MFKKIKEFFFPKKPLVLKDEVNLKGLEKKTKAELEKLGRKIGIELDKSARREHINLLMASHGYESTDYGV